MRSLVLLSFVAFAACGGRQDPQCFECGLSNEWARAEEEERQRADREAREQEQEQEQEAPADAGRAGAPQRCGGIAGSACPEGYRCIDDPSDSCDPKKSGADCIGMCVVPGAKVPAPALREGGASNSVRDKPGYCGQPGCGNQNKRRGPGAGPKPEKTRGCGLRSTAKNPWPCGKPKKAQPSPRERGDGDYESEWDRPDYCGTPGCGHEELPGPVRDKTPKVRTKSPLSHLRG